jgi:hypothetical protein
MLEYHSVTTPAQVQDGWTRPKKHPEDASNQTHSKTYISQSYHTVRIAIDTV